jgi:RNA recognition motif-containing protein
MSSIPEGTTEDDLRNHFAKYNPIAIRIVRTNTKDTRGFAFIQFDTEEHQTAAHDENRSFQFRGSESRVQFARRPQGSGRRPYRRRGPVRAARAPQTEGAATAAPAAAAGATPAAEGQSGPGPAKRRRPRKPRGPGAGAAGGDGGAAATPAADQGN